MSVTAAIVGVPFPVLGQHLLVDRPPAWVIALFCIAIVLVIVSLLLDRGLSWPRRLSIVALRVSVLAMLLAMSTGARLRQLQYERPGLRVVLDATESMRQPASLAETVPYSRWEFAQEFLFGKGGLQDTFGEDFEISIQEMTDGLSAPESLAAYSRRTHVPDGDSSPLGDLWEKIAVSPEQIQAVLLVSDGVVTTGRALERTRPLPVAVYPVVPEPAGANRNVGILALDYDSQALLGDRIVVAADVELSGGGAAGRRIELIDRETGEALASVEVAASGQLERRTVPLEFIAETAGTQRFRVQVAGDWSDSDSADDRLDGEIHVRDEPLNVLLVQDAPTYEFRFLKHALERAAGLTETGESRIKLTTVLQSGDPRYAQQDRTAVSIPPVRSSELAAIDVFILSDADPSILGNSLLQEIAAAVDEGAGLLVVAGQRHLPEALAGSPLEKLLPFPLSGGHAVLSEEGFRLDLTPLGEREPAFDVDQFSWQDAPPFYWRWRPAEIVPGAQILMQVADEPESAAWATVVTRPYGRGRVWFHGTDEVFRLAAANSAAHERFWLQVVRRLARGRLSGDENALGALTVDVLAPRAPGAVRAEVGFPPHSTVRSIRAAVVDSQGQRRSIPVDSRLGSQPSLEFFVDSLPAENYELWVWPTDREDEKVTQRFSIRETPGENDPVPVDVQALRSLAQSAGGAVLNASDGVSQLRRLVPHRAPRISGSKPPRAIWNHPLAALLLFGLLLGEWMLRRKWFLP